MRGGTRTAGPDTDSHTFVWIVTLATDNMTGSRPPLQRYLDLGPSAASGRQPKVNHETIRLSRSCLLPGAGVFASLAYLRLALVLVIVTLRPIGLIICSPLRAFSDVFDAPSPQAALARSLGHSTGSKLVLLDAKMLDSVRGKLGLNLSDPLSDAIFASRFRYHGIYNMIKVTIYTDTESTTEINQHPKMLFPTGEFKEG